MMNMWVDGLVVSKCGLELFKGEAKFPMEGGERERLHLSNGIVENV